MSHGNKQKLGVSTLPLVSNQVYLDKPNNIGYSESTLPSRRSARLLITCSVSKLSTPKAPGERFGAD